MEAIVNQPERTATDPVCGMTVDIEQAVRADLTAEHGGVVYYFCGKGCKLDFIDDSEKYLDPGHRPSM
jgi:YHS domain-containing protein